MAIAYTDYLQKRHSCYIYYTLPEYEKRDYESPISWYRIRYNFKRHKTYSGVVTKHTRKRIYKAVDLLVQISQEQKIYNNILQKWVTHKMSFITLTIPGKRTIEHHRAYEKLLKPWLRIMRDRYNLKSYVWKAELQKRGMIHFHITTNAFIYYYHIRDEWNNIMRKENLLDDKEKVYNSTDIREVYKEKHVCIYLSKYIAKNNQRDIKELISEQNEVTFCEDIIEGNILSGVVANSFYRFEIETKVWDASINLKGAKFYTVEATDFYNKRILNLADKNQLECITGDSCSIIKTDKQLMSGEHLKEYEKYIKKIKK